MSNQQENSLLVKNDYALELFSVLVDQMPLKELLLTTTTTFEQLIQMSEQLMKIYLKLYIHILGNVSKLAC